MDMEQRQIKVERKLDDISSMLTEIKIQQASYAVTVEQLSRVTETSNSRHQLHDQESRLFEMRLTRLESMSRILVFVASTSAAASIGIFINNFNGLFGGG